MSLIGGFATPASGAVIQKLLSVPSPGSTLALVKSSGGHLGMSKQGSRAKLHHYVPQGYLRGFASEKERITFVPLDGRASCTPSVKV